MAIYYIDPHTTTNGTGTYASPWSLASTTRTGLASNDEIRIKGVALTSLLTATSYTATVTNNYQLTITAGGGLGADWATGNVGYLPAFDTFFKVHTVTGNIVQVYTTTSMLPILDWSTTTVTLRRVDTTTYPAGTTGSYNIGSATAFSGISVSDCWTSATTRVTDGSVKTLFNTSSTTAISCFPAGSTSAIASTGWTIDLANTHVVCGAGTSTGYVDFSLGVSTGNTITVNQIFSWGSSGPGITFAGSGTSASGNTINITKFNNYGGFGLALNGTNNTINVTYLNTYIADIFGSGSSTVNAPNYTFNITNYSFNVVSSTAMIAFVNSAKATINVTGTIDQYGPTSATNIISGYGDVTLNIGASVVYYYNKRVASKTSFTASVTYTLSALVGDTFYVPTVNISNGWTVTNVGNVTTWASGQTRTSLPQIFNHIYPVNNRAVGTPYGIAGGINVLVTFKDGTAPQEILGVFGNGYYTSTANTNYPIVTTDATVYRTTGPSLKSNLTTKTAAVWSGSVNAYSKATKTIKVPCTSGQTYTVSGYVRSDDAAYANGDCRVGIWFNDAEVTGQNMTTACINAWEQFTLTFTASQTAEYVFTWSMYYANGAKSYWLDDLTIV